MKNFIAAVLIISMLLILVSPLNAFAYDNSDWTLGEVVVGIENQVVRNAIYIHDIVYGNDKFVAVGGYKDGISYTSEDGTNWTINYLEKSGEEFNKVIFGDNKFIAISDLNTISLSTDGEEWTSVEIGLDDVRLNDIIYEEEKYIAVGDEGYIISSEDGHDWNEIDSNTNRDLYGIAYGDGKYIVVGERGVMLKSSDGNEWKILDSRTDLCLNAVIYEQEKFMAKGSSGIVLTSTDGKYWRKSEFKDIDYDEDNEDDKDYKYHSGKIIYGNGKFIIDDGYVSNDGAKWDKNDYFGHVIAYGNNKFLTIKGAVKESDDGENWVDKWSLIWDAHLGIDSIAYGNGKFIGVNSYGLILSSENGDEWNIVSYKEYNDYFRKVIYGKDKFVALSYDSILLSEDGQSWEEIDVDLNGLNNIIYDGSKFIIVADYGKVLISENGYDWTNELIKNTQNLSSISYTGNKYVCISDNGRVYFSKDLEEWSEVNTNLDDISSDNDSISGDLYYSNGIFLLIYDENILISQDAQDWEFLDIDSKYDIDSLKVFHIVLLDDKFTAFIQYKKGYDLEKVLVYESSNGVKWTKIGEYDSYLDESDDFNTAAYGNDKYIIAGEGDKIFSISIGIEDPVDDPDVKRFDTAYDVSPHKNWKITFNKDIDENSIYNIKVLDSNGSNLADIGVTLNDSKTIIVNAPSEGYYSGEKYTLVIEGVKDLDGNSLKYKTVKDFVIE